MSEGITVLKSIDATLKAILRQLSVKDPHDKEIAPDGDLLGKYGDPVIKAKDPRDWTGAPMMGRKYSECPPAYLDLVADRLDYFADQAEAEKKTTSSGKPVAPYNRKDAARARGWAARIRSGAHVQTQQDDSDAGWATPPGEPAAAADSYTDDIPF